MSIDSAALRLALVREARPGFPNGGLTGLDDKAIRLLSTIRRVERPALTVSREELATLTSDEIRGRLQIPDSRCAETRITRRRVA